MNIRDTESYIILHVLQKQRSASDWFPAIGYHQSDASSDWANPQSDDTSDWKGPASNSESIGIGGGTHTLIFVKQTYSSFGC